jgi:hypothetical protein
MSKPVTTTVIAFPSQGAGDCILALLSKGKEPFMEIWHGNWTFNRPNMQYLYSSVPLDVQNTLSNKKASRARAGAVFVLQAAKVQRSRMKDWQSRF